MHQNFLQDNMYNYSSNKLKLLHRIKRYILKKAKIIDHPLAGIFLEWIVTIFSSLVMDLSHQAGCLVSNFRVVMVSFICHNQHGRILQTSFYLLSCRAAPHAAAFVIAPLETKHDKYKSAMLLLRRVTSETLGIKGTKRKLVFNHATHDGKPILHHYPLVLIFINGPQIRCSSLDHLNLCISSGCTIKKSKHLQFDLPKHKRFQFEFQEC